MVTTSLGMAVIAGHADKAEHSAMTVVDCAIDLNPTKDIDLLYGVYYVGTG